MKRFCKSIVVVVVITMIKLSNFKRRHLIYIFKKRPGGECWWWVEILVVVPQNETTLHCSFGQRMLHSLSVSETFRTGLLFATRESLGLLRRAKVLLTITSSYPISLIKTDINDLAALFKTNKRHKQFKSHKVQIEVWT
jgi:hypothetical protein